MILHWKFHSAQFFTGDVIETRYSRSKPRKRQSNAEDSNYRTGGVDTGNVLAIRKVIDVDDAYCTRVCDLNLLEESF